MISKRVQCKSVVDNDEAPKYKVGWWQRTKKESSLLLQTLAIVQLILTVKVTDVLWFLVTPK